MRRTLPTVKPTFQGVRGRPARPLHPKNEATFDRFEKKLEENLHALISWLENNFVVIWPNSKQFLFFFLNILFQVLGAL